MFEFNHGHVGPRYICGALRQFDAASFLFCKETNLHCLVVGANLSHATGAVLKLLGSASVESDNDCAGNGNCNNG